MLPRLNVARLEKFTTFGLAAFAVLVAAYVRWHTYLKPSPGVARADGRPPVVQSEPSRLPDSVLATFMEAGHRIGSDNAPVQIVEFGNFLCGYCGDLYGTLEKLRKKFPEHVAITFLHMASDGSVRSSAGEFALASECAAEQGAFEGFYHGAFSASTRIGSLAEYVRLAKRAGIADSARFVKCVRSRRHARKIDQQNAYAKGLGAPGPPAWAVNGRLIVGTIPLQDLERIVLAEIRPRSGEAMKATRDR